MDIRENKDEERINEEQVKMQNKQTRTIMIIGGCLILFFVLGFFITGTLNNFKYNGLDFTKEKIGDIMFYRTIFPLYTMTGEHVADYNIYMRNDPRSLKDIKIKGEINLKQDIVVNAIGIDDCEDKTIAIANMNNIFSSPVMNLHFFKNETLNYCDESGKFTYIQIQNSTEQGIEQFGLSCYYINIKDCEMLKPTEKFIAEILARE